MAFSKFLIGKRFYAPLTAIVLLAAFAILPVRLAGATGWTAKESLSTSRWQHSATLLPDGKLLVVGGMGSGGTSIDSVEQYDPATGHWTTVAHLITARRAHSATFLPNGKVLVAGGVDSSGSPVATAELYDPATGAWNAIGSMSVARAWHSATLLQNGKVLMTGGASFSLLASAELYDPRTNTWSATANTLTYARQVHTATLLPNGKVLVVGGQGAGTPYPVHAEKYDPESNSWSLASPMASGRWQHSATLLADGHVLIAGGANASGSLLTSELYDYASDSWSSTNSSLATARGGHMETVLPGGNVLVTGGQGTGGTYQASCEMYDATYRLWRTADPMATPRFVHSATLLANGKILVVGGQGTGGVSLSSVEQYDPPPVIKSFNWQPMNGPFNTAIITDTNGEWGLSHPVGSVSVYVDGGSLAYTDSGEGTYVFKKLSASPTNPLVGTWSAGDFSQPDNAVVVTFLDDTKVIFAQDGSSVEDPTGWDGMERGTYAWDPASGAFTVSLTVDTNGEWGLSHPQGAVTLFVDGDTLWLTDAVEGIYTLHRVKPSPTNPLVGTWFAGDLSQPDNAVVVTFLDDANVIFAQDGSSIEDPTGGDGMERATYSFTPKDSFLEVPLLITSTDDTAVTGYYLSDNYFQPPGPLSEGWVFPAPTSYNLVTGGPRTLYAWVKDAAGNISPPLSITITIEAVPDTSPPYVTISSKPASPANTSTATFSFFSSNDVLATFECKVDAGAFTACASPFTTAFLSNGTHTFMVRAKDLAGNVTPLPATYTWAIDAPPDTSIISFPPVSTTATSAIFTFTSPDVTASFECVLDNGNWGACSSGASYNALPLGSHTFAVRAKDLTGNYDPTPAGYAWTIISTASTQVKIGDASFASLNAALSAAGSGELLKLMASMTPEAVNYTGNSAITLAGGYDAGWNRQAGAFSTVSSLTIAGGTVTIDGITIR